MMKENKKEENMNSKDRGNNSNIELITGDYKQAIKKLAWPMMVSMFLVMAYNLADSIWVAGLGSDALAAIGFITPLFMILVGLGNGVGAGANSLIARYIGAKDKDGVNNAALHSLVLTLIISILGSVVMYIILPTLLEIMGAGSSTQLALDYGNIVFMFMIVFIYSNVGAAILRSEGDVTRAMYVMAITAILNIVLDPIFIYILGMGIAGAAWATVISATVSCAVLLYWMHVKKDTFIDLTLSNYHTSGYIYKNILTVAIPSTAENLIFSVLGICINYFLVIVSGNVAVATYTAGMRLIQLSMIPLVGFGTALLTVIGVSYGAHDFKRLNDSFYYTLKLGLLISTIMAVIFYIFAPQISIIFAYGSTASLAPRIASLIRLMIIFIYGVCLGMVSAMLFQGVGKGFTSLTLTFIRALLLEVVVAYILGILLGMGEQGVYLGVVSGGLLGGIISFLYSRFYISRLEHNYTQSK